MDDYLSEFLLNFIHLWVLIERVTILTVEQMMKHEWMAEVLQDMMDYVCANDMLSLLPMLDGARKSVLKHIDLPIKLSEHRFEASLMPPVRRRSKHNGEAKVLPFRKALYIGQDLVQE